MDNRTVTLTIGGKEVEVLEISARNAAKELKADLRALYPNVRFSVHATMSGYRPMLVVAWTDGPQYHEVKNVADRFRGRDEEERSIIHQRGDGQQVMYRVGLVMLNHEFTDPEQEHESVARSCQPAERSNQ